MQTAALCSWGPVDSLVHVAKSAAFKFSVGLNPHEHSVPETVLSLRRNWTQFLNSVGTWLAENEIPVLREELSGTRYWFTIFPKFGG